MSFTKQQVWSRMYMPFKPCPGHTPYFAKLVAVELNQPQLRCLSSKHESYERCNQM